MSATSVADTISGNGHGPAPHPGLCLVPLLATKVDQLARLRELLAAGQAAERALSQELLAGLQAHHLTRLVGRRAVAVVITRPSWVPVVAADPEPGFEEYEPVTVPVLQITATKGRAS